MLTHNNQNPMNLTLGLQSNNLQSNSNKTTVSGTNLVSAANGNDGENDIKELSYSTTSETSSSSKADSLDRSNSAAKKQPSTVQTSYPVKSSLNVITSLLSSNSCSSSISTSSTSSSVSDSHSSTTNSFTTSTNLSIAENLTAIPSDKATSFKVLSMSDNQQSDISVANETASDLSLLSDSTNEFSNSNLTSAPYDSPSSFKRMNFGGSFKEANYKKQKANYLSEKKRINNDMLTIMRDESIIVLADWLKIRGSLKNWIKVYVVLKPGIVLLYKSDKLKTGQWIGSILLNSCQLLERPSKKHGFCFKLFHPMEKSIWASKGPVGETYINVPYMLLPTFYLIFRASSETIGQIWMDAIELTLRSSHLIKPTNSFSFLNKFNSTDQNTVSTNSAENSISDQSSKLNCAQVSRIHSFIEDRNLSPNIDRIQITKSMSSLNSTELMAKQRLKEVELEKMHFNQISQDQQDETIHSDSDAAKNSSDDICSLNSSNNDGFYENQFELKGTNIENVVEETKYVVSPKEVFGDLGNKGQTEEVDEDNRSLIFCLAKQVRPGMDLSKVVLPTFILEPRSFLEKLTDFYYHSDLLNESISNDDPYGRMVGIIKFYLSGFYKKPKGLKKPYNPILGEVFRSYWYNPKTDSKTFYIAEQISHHPPITSIYVSNRKEGFCIYGTILARSKFYGNSVSAIMEGQIKLILLNRGEEYVITMPYANCKGILIGKLTMELGGKISIECAKTGYSAEIEFKLKPLLGGLEASNLIDGRIKFAKETIATLSGRWDGEIYLTEKTDKKQNLLWNPTKQVIESRLQRYIVPLEEQKEFESEILWLKVSEAIKKCDQNLATEEKSIIEIKQREEYADRKSRNIEYLPKFFSYDCESKQWLYNFSDLRPWDNQTDQFQYENDFKIATKSKHDLSKLRNQSITDTRVNCLLPTPQILLHSESRNELASNKSTNENSFDIGLQYTDIKQRLNAIEEQLQTITNSITLDANKTPVDTIHLYNRRIANKATKRNEIIEPSLNPQSIYNLSHFFNLTNLLIALVAWLVGLISAVFSNKILGLSSK